jgi:hypothetical protein
MSESITRPGLLGTLTRLWLLRRLPGPLPAVHDGVLAIIAIAAFALWVVLDRSSVGEDAAFSAYSLPNVGWYALIGLWIALAIARRSAPQIPFRSAMFVIVALAPALALLGGLVDVIVGDDLLVYANAILALYVVVYVARAARSITGKSQIPAVAGIALVLIGLGWFNSYYGISPALWYETDTEEDSAQATAWSRSEALLFDQPARIDAALGRMKTAAPKTPAVTSPPRVFFLGFAGMGEQRVFAEEIKLAAYNIGRRYGSDERSVLLVNDRRDVDKQPFATESGLRYALKGIAARMNIDRDVLFLALSSHGSEDPVLSVSNSSLPLRDLTGTALASALKDSGIKWKVIVISACHAGAFIPFLRDDYTAVLTAAAADRTSFGCTDDRDLTYFGEAFYRDAIPATKTLRAAFAQTVTNIAVREKDEDMKPSKPQAFFGQKMDQKLAEIERVP